MATLRTKTVRYFFDTKTTDLATNTTLGTATRYDTTTLNVGLPENSSRTFLSVLLRFSYRDRFTVANEVTGVRMGIKLGAASTSDTDRSFTQANTGDHLYDEWWLDVTDYFTANYGSGTTQTAVASLAVSSTAASNIGGNITAELVITYQYDDDVGTTRVKSIPIPIGSHSTTLTTAQQEVGTDGTNPPPSAQIPALATYLEEASVAIQQAALVITANDAAGTAVDLNPEIQIDSAAAVARGVIGQALQTLVPYRDVYLYDTSTFSTATTHTFKMRDTTTSARFANTGAILWVTYTYDKSTSTRQMNVGFIPLTMAEADTDGLTNGTSFSNNVAGDAQSLTGSLDITEPGTITLKQSAMVAMLAVSSSSAGALVSAGGQAYRTYTPAASSGEAPIIHRSDYGSGWSLARGRNTLQIRIYAVTANRSTLVGAYAIVVWSSDVPSQGTEAGTRAVTFLNAVYGTTPATTIDVAASGGGQRAITLGSPWRLCGLLLEGRMRASATAMQSFLERRAGEFEAAGFATSDARRTNGIAELCSYWWYDGFTKSFNGDHLHTGKLAPETSRRQVIYVAGGSILGQWATTVTYHQCSFTVAGTVTINGVAAADGKTVKIFAMDSAGAVDLVTTVTVAGGAGAFTAGVPDNFRTYWASYVDAGASKYGRSLDGTPSSSTFNITIGGVFTSPPFPVLTNATTREAIRDRAIAVLQSLTPALLEKYGFKKYLNEGAGDFVKWATANPAAAFRRFQVRWHDGDDLPETSNTDSAQLLVKMVITVAYAQDGRAGRDQALDRDDLIDKDWHQIDNAIGLLGRFNFTAPNPDATTMGCTDDLVEGNGVDFLVITATFRYLRATLT